MVGKLENHPEEACVSGGPPIPLQLVAWQGWLFLQGDETGFYFWAKCWSNQGPRGSN